MKVLLVASVAVLLGVLPGGKKSREVQACCHAHAHAMYEQCMQAPGNDARSCYNQFMQEYQTCVKSGGSGAPECAVP